MTEPLQKKRLLIIANVTNTHAHRFIREFKNRGWEIKIVSVQPPNRKNIEEFNGMIVQIPTYAIYRWLIKLPFFKYSEFHNKNSGVKWYEPYSISAYINYFYLLFFIKKISKKVAPTGIFSIVMNINGLFAALSGIKNSIVCSSGGELPIPNIFTIDYWAFHPALFEFIVKKSKRVIALGGDDFKIPAIEKISHEPKIVKMNHWGVDTNKFKPRGEHSRTKVCKFICSRPYREQFDFEGILLALNKIYKINKDIQLTIASGAISENNLQSLYKIIKTCGSPNYIEILYHVDYSELPNIIQKHDVYIDPINIHKFPKTAGWGISGSFLEAMACGLIPVVSNRRDIDWILPEEGKSFVYDYVTTELSDALLKAIEFKDDKRIHEVMRKAVIEKADWQQNVNLIEDMIRVFN